MKKISIFLVLIASSLLTFGQALYPVSNAEKATNATLIVEGEVVSQVSFWNVEHTMIFTSNKVKVYKIFKGSLQKDYIEILTQGGTVGYDNVTVSDLLELSEKEVGVFFCFPENRIKTSPAGGQLWDVYASSQGFFKYNVEANTAADPFSNYNSILGEVYPLLANLSGRKFTTVDPSLKIGKQIANQGRPNAYIASFSPTTVNSGATSDPTNNLLTITGIDFGTPSGLAKVRFGDCNYDPSSGIKFDVPYTSNLIVSWTDTEIKIRVPTRAGTGVINVMDASGATATSLSQLTVFYSILSFTADNFTKQSNLSNVNGSGGYTMQYSTTLTAEAVATYNRALTTWVEVAGLNVAIGSSTSTSNAVGDGKCVVFMDNAANGTPLSAGVLAVCYSFNSYCSPASSVDYRKPEFDVNIRSSYSTGTTTFELGPCPPGSSTIDLETVLLHELGHGLNLGHIIAGSQGGVNPPKLMNYAVSNGVKRTAPDASCYQGALYTCATNAALAFGGCTAATGMTQLTPIIDSKDECPVTFPASATPPGTQVFFDLEHSTSNANKDPQYNNVICTGSGVGVTNNLYYVVLTDASGSLDIDVTNFNYFPASASVCTGSNAPTARIAVYQTNTCPTGQSFPFAMACRSFTGNGPLTTISGLNAQTYYLLYVDGKQSAKTNFTLTFNGSAFPIKLERFTGEVKTNSNDLKWVISAFSDVNKIVLERSANGSEFEPLNTYSGNVLLNREYLYSDVNPFSGANYYRLSTYNKDGTIQYSNVVLLKRSEKIKINVFPNPVKNVVNLSFNTVESLGPVQIKLYNNIGQLILVRAVNISSGINNFEIKADRMAVGSYKMIISNQQNEIIRTINLQKQ